MQEHTVACQDLAMFLEDLNQGLTQEPGKILLSSWKELDKMLNLGLYFLTQFEAWLACSYICT
jgi:hypothetical protein